MVSVSQEQDLLHVSRIIALTLILVRSLSAFEPEKFGDSITVERTIKRAGGGDIQQCVCAAWFILI